MILSEEEDIEKLKYSSDMNIELMPWYNGSNMNFFKKYVFNTFGDIISNPVSKQKIFRRQVLNENFFGKLLIYPDGIVHANANFPSIPSSAWFLTRDRSSGNCKNCINRYLCPSISNYEIVAGIDNMCYLNTKS